MSIIKSFLPIVAAQLLVSASPLPADTAQIVAIPLQKSRAFIKDGVVNSKCTKILLERTIFKYANGLASWAQNTGNEYPLSYDPGSLNVNFTTPTSTCEPLQDDNNGELWQGSISVGTPADPVRTLTVQFDTGSSDLFLPGPDCQQNCQGHSIYNPETSVTAVDLQERFQLNFGDGDAVQGEQYNDTVSILGLVARNQTLGAASTYSTGFAQNRFPPDGLLGMAYQSISVYNSLPFFQSLVAQSEIAKPIFAFKLSPSESELTLGGVDDSLYTGNFTYTPVTTKGFWQVKLDTISVNGASAVGLGPSSSASIIDTGTTFVIGDAPHVRALYSKIPGSKDASSTFMPGSYTIPCNSTAEVSLTFGGRAFSISPELFKIGRISQGSQDCVGGVVSLQGMPFWVIGDIFLQNVYTSFDFGADMVGFATLK